MSEEYKRTRDNGIQLCMQYNTAAQEDLLDVLLSTTREEVCFLMGSLPRRRPASQERSATHKRLTNTSHAPERSLWARQADERCAASVCSVRRDGVAPPRRDVVLAYRAVRGVLQAEEDHNGADGDARVERGGQHIYASQCESAAYGP